MIENLPNASQHRVDKVLGFFYIRPNWDSFTPSPLWFGGGGGVAVAHSLAGEGVWEFKFGRGDRH
jgi:hypothetical protein